MKVLRYDPQNKASILAEALVVLLSGGSVVYPTETAYALGADFFSPHAYRNIFNIKNRAEKKPLPVIVPDLRYAVTLVQFPSEASRLAEKYWPGPLTLVLPFLYRKQWPHHRDDYLALRVSPHPLAASLSIAFGRPLISTSANISGADPCYRIEQFMSQLGENREKPDLIIDVGEIPRIMPSTIVKVGDKGMEVLRKGTIEVHL